MACIFSATFSKFNLWIYI